MKFSSPALALEWAETILSIREGGRSNAAFMEHLDNGGICLDYAVLDALEIRHAARQSCVSGWPCPYIRHECLFNWLVPDPCVEYPRMSYAQEQRVMACATTFAERLRKKGFLE
jgi:hypothetical protein